jgi:hypothetical protein
MDFKFYHGTSSIFLESIRECGLGGINPNIEYRNLDLLKFLSAESEKHLLDNEEYLKIRNSVVAMARQTDLIIRTDTGEDLVFNYRHDGIYVSLTRERAVIYACINGYGSEILAYSIDMYLKLKNKFKNFQLPNELNRFGIEKFVNKKHKSILIEIDGLNETELETEYGDDAKILLDKLRIKIPNMSPKEKFELLQYANFKLLTPVPIDKIRFFEIDFDGHPGDRDFAWTLSRI